MRLPFSVPVRAHRAWDIVGVGLNSVDMVAVMAGHPAAGSKHELERVARFPGGETATALAVCARQGLRARYIGTFGGDELGALSRESLIAEGVDIAEARTIADATNQFSLILVDADTGQRTVFWRRDPRLRLTAADIPEHVVLSARMLVVDGHEPGPATAAARIARLAGIPTIVDVETVRTGTSALLTQIDAVIAAEGFPSALTGEPDLGRALEAMARECQSPLVAVTLGAEGSLARCGGREIRTPAFAGACVDTTGAGDAFRGGFAAFCLWHPEGTLEEALAYANATAALNCRALGARGGLPTRDEVARLVEQGPL